MSTVTNELFNREPAPKLGKPGHVWTGVHKREVVTKDTKDHPWVCRCPAPMCFYNTSHRAEKDAQTALATHTCPWFAGGPTTFSWGVMAQSFVAPIWKLLDECMDIIKGAYDLSWDDDRCRMENQQARQQARAYANTLAILMPPFFHHPDEIAREALLRWEKGQAGEDYETPGMGARRYERAETTKVAAKPAATVPRTYAPRTGKVLSEDEKQGIKMALSMGGFPVEQLAKTYGVGTDQIEALR